MWLMKYCIEYAIFFITLPRELTHTQRSQKPFENGFECENLKKEHEKEIVLLKNEVRELKVKLYAKTATDETNDSLIFVHDTEINPSEFQEEYIMNTEITIKEEPIE